jgi:hypothetical protein
MKPILHSFKNQTRIQHKKEIYELIPLMNIDAKNLNKIVVERRRPKMVVRVGNQKS